MYILRRSALFILFGVILMLLGLNEVFAVMIVLILLLLFGSNSRLKRNHKKYINNIVESLKKIPGIKCIYRREELFNGPFIERLPEIYIEPDFDRGFVLGETKITFDIVKRRPLLRHHPLGVFFIKKWDFDTEFPKVIPNYMVTNIIMSLFNVPLSYMADGLDLLNKLLNRNIMLTDLYLRRWKIIKRISLVKLSRTI